MAISLSMENVVFRPARFDDYDELVEMSKGLFSGNDYLATLFYEFLHAPDMFPYVAEYEGKVLSYHVVNVFGGGRFHYRLGGRTRPGYEGLGIMNKLQDSLNTVLRGMYPDVRVYLTVGLGNTRQDRYIQSDPRILIRHKWSEYLFRGTSLELRECLDRRTSGPVAAMTKALSYAESLAAIPGIIDFLKRAGLPFIYSLPLPFLPREITAESLRRILMSSSATCTEIAGSGVSSISIHHTMTSSVKDGLVSSFDFHGDSLVECFVHLELYFESILRIFPSAADSVAMFINIPEELGHDVNDFMEKRFNDNISMNNGRDDIYLIEMPPSM